MANYTHSDYKQFGPQVVKDNADTIALVKNPIKSDNYATFSGKIIAQAAMAGTDVNFAASGEDLQVTINGKSGIDPSGTAASADDICVAVFDSVGQKVYIVQDANDRDITNEAGDTVNIPALVTYIREMTATV